MALPDEFRETTVRRIKKLCDSCGCHNERKLAVALAKKRRPRACPMARLLIWEFAPLEMSDVRISWEMVGDGWR